MRAFVVTLRVIADDKTEPTAALFKKLRGPTIIDARLVGYSEEAMPEPRTQAVRPAGFDAATVKGF